jgi:glucosamine--fructose-6-phosphate aminotransferase (isomerizing)
MDFNGKSVSYEITKVSHDLITSVGEYEHYTIKEICEQYVLLGEQHNVSEVREKLKAVKNLYITGSGSSYNVAKYAKFLFAKCSDMIGSTNCIVSSEFEFELESVKDHSTVLAISQSGESADVLNAVKLAKNKGCEIISITNSPNSELARMSDIVIDMKCGREVGVAATKSFMVTAKIITELINGPQTELWTQITHSLEEELGNSKMLIEIMTLAKKLAVMDSIYVIGRGIGIPLADEIALKLKELTYIHVESIYGGELKHGPLSLIDKESFVIAVNHSSMSESMDKTIMELKSRGATVYEITDKPIELESFEHGYRTDVKVSSEYFMFVILLPMQLLAYHTAIEKNNNPDFPRNLAKSVTVK